MKYKLIQSVDIADFELQISICLSDGWELYGAPQITHNVIHDGTSLPVERHYYSQALTMKAIARENLVPKTV